MLDLIGGLILFLLGGWILVSLIQQTIKNRKASAAGLHQATEEEEEESEQ